MGCLCDLGNAQHFQVGLYVESIGPESPAGSCRPDVSDCGYLWPSLFFFGDSANCLVGQLGSNPTTFHFCLNNCLC